MNRLARLALAVVSGLLFAFAFPNVALGWLAFVALFPLLIAVMRARSGWEAALIGWVAQSVAWMLMVPWVVRTMSHYGGLSNPVGVLLYLAMSWFLGLYGAAFGAIVYRLRLDRRFARWLLVPLAWAALEYARTYLFSGFPWNLLAAALIDIPQLIQIDRFAGPYFVAFLILLPQTVAVWWLTQRPHGTARLIAAGGVSILLFVWWMTGLVASKLIPRPTGEPSVRVALLQPNISQEMRWDAQQVAEIYERMMRMTLTAADAGAQVVIWPESTVPLSFSSTDTYRSSVEAVSKARNIDILLGSVAEDPGGANRIWNSAFLVSGGTTVGHYDKIRLVPFGEYVPLRKMLFFAKKLTRAVGEFAFGNNDQPLRGKLRYGPAICYEVVFPQITRTQVRNGAEVLVTITNDAWFDGSAPVQHLNQARLRAIEDDRYLLRAATTGISAFVDPTGRVISSLAMNREGIIYADVVARRGGTLYVRWGEWFAWFSVVSVGIGLIRRRKANAE